MKISEEWKKWNWIGLHHLLLNIFRVATELGVSRPTLYDLME
jgi:hypothetical protein